jgi:hypothetical protein
MGCERGNVLSRGPVAGALAALAALALSAGPAAAQPLSPRLGMRLDGALWRQHAGAWIAAAGDVNGDGLADVLVGTAESHHLGAGRPAPTWNAYVVFGRRRLGGGALCLDRLGRRGLRIVRHGGAGFGAGAGAGDVNGDGLDDIVLGTGTAEEAGGGRVWIIPGRRRGGTVDVGRPGAAAVLRAPGGVRFGRSVAAAGDLDHDGLADVLVSEPGWVPPGGEFGTGRVVVVFGSRHLRGFDIAASARRTMQIIGPGPFHLAVPGIGDRLYGPEFGQALAAAGDVDGNGRPDVAISAPYLGGRDGGAFVVTGPFARGASIDLRTAPAGSYRIAGAGGQVQGWALAAAGDQDGDGLGDLLVGELAGGDALASSHGPSAAFVVRGRTGGDVALGDLGTSGTTLLDAVAGDRAGQSVALAGDLTGDGLPDLVIGAPLADPGGRSRAGSAFLVPGGQPAGTLDLRRIPGVRRLDGVSALDTAGDGVAGVGDIDGDRAPDIAVAAPRTDLVRERSGSVYLVSGRRLAR